MKNELILAFVLIRIMISKIIGKRTAIKKLNIIAMMLGVDSTGFMVEASYSSMIFCDFCVVPSFYYITGGNGSKAMHIHTGVRPMKMEVLLVLCERAHTGLGGDEYVKPCIFISLRLISYGRAPYENGGTTGPLRASSHGPVVPPFSHGFTRVYASHCKSLVFVVVLHGCLVL